MDLIRPSRARNRGRAEGGQPRQGARPGSGRLGGKREKGEEVLERTHPGEPLEEIAVHFLNAFPGLARQG